MSRTVAGQAGKPLTLASTRSPTFHWRRAAAAAAALPAPFLRLGAIGESQTQPTNSMTTNELDLWENRLSQKQAKIARARELFGSN